MTKQTDKLQELERDAAGSNVSGVEFQDELVEVDDDYTVADMSMLGDRTPFTSSSSRDIREELGDPDDRRALIFGATWAGLSIGLIYIVVFGLVIALMLLIWG